MKKILFFFLVLLFLLPLISALQLPPNVQKMFDDQQQIALGITFLAAFLAGIVTFTSPCGFALLPTFFAVTWKERSREKAMIFSLGLVFAFMGVGILAGIMGNFFNPYKLYLAFFSGIALVVFGMLLLVERSFPFYSFPVQRSETSWKSLFSVGFFFALGWSPCIGTILGGIFLLAANTGTWIQSVALLLTYAVGIITPLIVFATTTEKYNLTRFYRGKALFGIPLMNLFGGLILISMGIIMMVYNGTDFFQRTIPEYLPWDMLFWGEANQVLASHSFFRSSVAHGAGFFLVFVLVGMGIKKFMSLW